jgi:hypothetical protein
MRKHFIHSAFIFDCVISQPQLLVEYVCMCACIGKS